MSEQGDVVERLEARTTHHLGPDGRARIDPLCREAAAEIRRLRSMLEGAVEGWAVEQPSGAYRFAADPKLVSDPAPRMGGSPKAHRALLLLPRDTEAE